jgi:hypothetical protein
VLQKLGRRVFDLVIGLFALLGFFFVPLGRHTGFEHLKAIAATGPATEAYRELLEAGARVRKKLFERSVPRRPDPGERGATRPEATNRQTTKTGKTGEKTSEPGLVRAEPNQISVELPMTAAELRCYEPKEKLWPE